MYRELSPVQLDRQVQRLVMRPFVLASSKDPSNSLNRIAVRCWVPSARSVTRLLRVGRRMASSSSPIRSSPREATDAACVAFLRERGCLQPDGGRCPRIPILRVAGGPRTLRGYCFQRGLPAAPSLPLALPPARCRSGTRSEHRHGRGESDFSRLRLECGSYGVHVDDRAKARKATSSTRSAPAVSA